jgi:hypothetical protein
MLQVHPVGGCLGPERTVTMQCLASQTTMFTTNNFFVVAVSRSAVTALKITVGLFAYLLISLFLGQMNGVLRNIGEGSLALMKFTVELLGLPTGGAILPTSLFWGIVAFNILLAFRVSRRNGAGREFNSDV